MPEVNSQDYMQGISAFQSARQRAFWSDLFNLIRGKPAELLSFDEVKHRLRLREENYRGLHDIPLDKIVGSVGRYHEFTAGFLPKRGNMQERWSRVYAVTTGPLGLPPVELYKVGDVYFVRDGNHRVSVARQLGSATIQAHVTELPTSIELRPGMTEEELDAAEAYARFLEVTRLGMTRPHLQSITLTEPSRYVDLLGHVYLHQAVMSQETDREVPIEEAAADWYDRVYRPAVTLIRKYNILDEKSDRTEADLYLWMIDHMREMKEEMGDDTPIRSYHDALLNYLSSRRIPAPNELSQERGDTVEIARVDIEAIQQAAEAAAATVAALEDLEDMEEDEDDETD
ncbi:MAG: hypothetical protein U0452_03940 [Anaerolineae bacterium]